MSAVCDRIRHAVRAPLPARTPHDGPVMARLDAAGSAVTRCCALCSTTEGLA